MTEIVRERIEQDRETKERKAKEKQRKGRERRAKHKKELKRENRSKSKLIKKTAKVNEVKRSIKDSRMLCRWNCSVK